MHILSTLRPWKDQKDLGHPNGAIIKTQHEIHLRSSPVRSQGHLWDMPSFLKAICGHREPIYCKGIFLPPKKQPQESKVKTTWIPTPHKHPQRNSRPCWGIVNHHHPQIISSIRPYIPPWKGSMAISTPISLGLSWPRILIIHLLGLQ